MSTAMTTLQFSDLIDARNAVRLIRENGRKARWKRVPDPTGNRVCVYIVIAEPAR